MPNKMHSPRPFIPIVGETSIEGSPGSASNAQYKHNTCNCGRTDGKCSCGNIEEMQSVYVYTIGRIECRFPRLSVEKEFAQVTGRSDTAGLTDRQAFHSVLSQK